MQEMRSRVASGALWLGLGRGVTNLIGIASTLLLARLLTPADFGLVALATTMLAIIAVVTELSLAVALVQHQEPTEDHFHAAWSLNLARGVLIGLGFAAAGWPAAMAFGEPDLAPIMVVLGFATIINGLQNPKMVVYTRTLRFTPELILNISAKLLGFIAAAAVAFTTQSYWALVAGSVASQATVTLGSYILMPYRPRFSMARLPDLWSFSIWLTLSQVILTLSQKFDQLVIGALLGKTPLGYYSVGENLAAIPTREATAPLMQTLFPAFSRLRGEPHRLTAAYSAAQPLVTAVALPLAIGLALVAEPVVRLTMGEKWLPAVFIIQVLAAMMGLQTVSGAVQPLAWALGETKRLAQRDLLFLGIRIPAVLAGLWIGGLTGVVIARGAVGIVSIYVGMELVRSMIGMPVRTQIFANFRAIAAVTVMAVAVIFVQMETGMEGEPLKLIGLLAVQVVAGGIVYIGASYALWQAAGFPDGPEREVARIAAKVLDILRRRATA